MLSVNDYISGCDILGAEASQGGSVPIVVTSTKYENAQANRSPGITDNDPVILKKGTTIYTAGNEVGDYVSITIPPNTPIYSSILKPGSTNMTAHTPVDITIPFWVKRNLLNLSPKSAAAPTPYPAPSTDNSNKQPSFVITDKTSEAAMADSTREMHNGVITIDETASGIKPWHIGIVAGGVAVVGAGLWLALRHR